MGRPRGGSQGQPHLGEGCPPPPGWGRGGSLCANPLVGERGGLATIPISQKLATSQLCLLRDKMLVVRVEFAVLELGGLEEFSILKLKTG